MYYAFAASRSYRDGHAQWHRTTSLDEEDLLPAEQALETAYSKVQAVRQKGRAII
jgi:hypothetical protein